MKYLLLLLILFFTSNLEGKNKHINRALKSTVYVEAYEYNSFMEGQPVDHFHGGGVIIRKDGYIVTCRHLVKDSYKIRVVYDNDTLIAKLVGIDDSLDIAVLKVEKDIPVIYVDKKNKYKIGDPIYTLGFPLSLGITLNKGIISSRVYSHNIGEDNFDVNYIQTDAVINPGNSGGGLFDNKFRLIGINSLMVSFTGYYIGYSFAIPIDKVLKSVDKIIENNKPLYFIGQSAAE